MFCAQSVQTELLQLTQSLFAERRPERVIAANRRLRGLLVSRAVRIQLWLSESDPERAVRHRIAMSAIGREVNALEAAWAQREFVVGDAAQRVRRLLHQFMDADRVATCRISQPVAA